MTDAWKMVRWSEARQIAEILAWEDAPGAELKPKAFFDQLVDAAKFDDALAFLSQSLGRFEVVAWAVSCVRELRSSTPERPKPSQMAALRSASKWLQDIDEKSRREAEFAAQQAPNGSAESLLAYAVFFSGGSIAPEDVDAIPAPRVAVGQFALGAVLTAVAEHPDPSSASQNCLAIGDKIASSGL